MYEINISNRHLYLMYSVVELNCSASNPVMEWRRIDNFANCPVPEQKEAFSLFFLFLFYFYFFIFFLCVCVCLFVCLFFTIVSD